MPDNDPKKQFKLTLKEYQTLKSKTGLKGKVKIPVAVQFLLATPLLIVFCFGLFFIPYIIFIIITGWK